jgi:hypothetical protein
MRGSPSGQSPVGENANLTDIGPGDVGTADVLAHQLGSRLPVDHYQRSDDICMLPEGCGKPFPRYVTFRLGVSAQLCDLTDRLSQEAVST